jgi:tRNA(Glu) U13 pseudouridine synthase TruD
LSESIETPGDPELPLVSGEIPGTGGSIKVTPEEVQPEEAALRLRFTLPSGSYATVLLREIMHGGSQQG